MSARRRQVKVQPTDRVDSFARFAERKWIAPLALVLLTLVAYAGALRCGYIWDDNFHITENPTLRDLRGLARIWTDISATPQYYPLVHTTFWLEFHAWGLNPIGYHLVNLLLHALAAILFWRGLRILRVPGAWIAAAIFALHPIEVESVAWITERKNVLSGVFYFAAALAYLRFGLTSHRAWRWYFIALLLFVCALLSKTVTCSLPVALLLIDWWKNGKVQRRDLLLLAPFFAIGFVLGLVTVWIERHHVGAEGSAWTLTFADRVLIAGRAIWFYAGKLIWPAKLTFIYPRWQVNAAAVWLWVFPIAFVAVAAALWFARKRIGRGPLAAVAFFAVSLGPALGFANVYPFRYSFVADHFQYLAGAGLIALAGAGLSRLPRVVPAIVLAILALLTALQLPIYRNLETLWRDTLNKNPESWMPRVSYAAVLLGEGKMDEALVHLRKAEQLAPDNAETQNGIGVTLKSAGRLDESLPYFERAVALNPNAAAAHYNLGDVLLQEGRPNEALPFFERAMQADPTYAPAYNSLGNAELQLGRADEALATLQRALALDPTNTSAHFNLANTLLQMHRTGEALAQLEVVLRAHPRDPDALKNMAWLLATAPDPSLRDGAKAVQLAETANESTQGTDPMIGATLAAAYAEAGRFNAAIFAAQNALRLAVATRNAALERLLRYQLDFFGRGQPYRDAR